MYTYDFTRVAIELIDSWTVRLNGYLSSVSSRRGLKIDDMNSGKLLRQTRRLKINLKLKISAIDIKGVKQVPWLSRNELNYCGDKLSLILNNFVVVHSHSYRECLQLRRVLLAKLPVPITDC